MFTTKPNVSSNFVCLDDVVSASHVTLNRVIFNPIQSKEFNTKILKDVGKTNFSIEFTDEDIAKLVSFDKDHLNEFVEEFQEIVSVKQDEFVVAC